MNNLKSRILSIISNKLNLSIHSIKDDSNFINDLGADSLDIIEIIIDVEKELNIELKDSETEKIQKVSDLLKYVDNHISK
ncbi:MAG: acyl carrier protein [Bacteroides sp.]|nr:MAG: acyl carrier protein [Bacteroides sp.]